MWLQCLQECPCVVTLETIMFMHSDFLYRLVFLRWLVCTCRAWDVMRCCRASLWPLKWVLPKQTLTRLSLFTPPHLRSLSRCANTNTHPGFSRRPDQHTRAESLLWITPTSAWRLAFWNDCFHFLIFSYINCACCFYFFMDQDWIMAFLNCTVGLDNWLIFQVQFWWLWNGRDWSAGIFVKWLHRKSKDLPL